MQKMKNYSRKPVVKKADRKIRTASLPETGGHFKAKRGDSLNAERAAIFAEMPTKIYKISLNKDFSILDADQALDASSVRSILLRAGVSEVYLKFRHDDQLTDFNKAADLLC